MTYYSDGRPVQVGDSVDFDGEPATVIEVLESNEQLAAEGLKEPLVGFATSTLGEVYQSPCDGGWDGILLLSRSPTHF